MKCRRIQRRPTPLTFCVNIRPNKDKTALQVAIDKHGKDSVIALFLQKAMEKSGKINEEKAEELLRALE